VGRIPSGQSYQIKHLNERHQEIARRIVLGEKPTDIAADLGVSRELVSVVKGSELGASYIGELEAERNAYTMGISVQLGELCPAAMQVLKYSRMA
jgi:FixJ family two-component response regulator